MKRDKLSFGQQQGVLRAKLKSLTAEYTSCWQESNRLQKNNISQNNDIYCIAPDVVVFWQKMWKLQAGEQMQPVWYGASHLGPELKHWNTLRPTPSSRERNPSASFPWFSKFQTVDDLFLNFTLRVRFLLILHAQKFSPVSDVDLSITLCAQSGKNDLLEIYDVFHVQPPSGSYYSRTLADRQLMRSLVLSKQQARQSAHRRARLRLQMVSGRETRSVTRYA